MICSIDSLLDNPLYKRTFTDKAQAVSVQTNVSEIVAKKCNVPAISQQHDLALAVCLIDDAFQVTICFIPHEEPM